MGASVGNKGYVSEINVTPFVDVMLVLLIIFMVTAPMMTEGLDVDLPQTQAVQSLPTDTDHVVLTIKKDGSIFLNEYNTPVQNLAAQLVATVKNQNRQLFLQADKEVPYGIVVDVMGRVKAAGIDHMGLVAERVDDAAALIPPVPPSAPGTPAQNSPSGRRR